MSQLIKCPNCDTRSWSKDYWVCPDCGYSESKEEVLLEENKDYLEGRDRGDEPALDLGFWMREQEDLTKEMIKECLPGISYKVEFNRDLGGDWGGTNYYEPDLQERELFKLRHAKTLIEKGRQGKHWEIKIMPNGQQVIVPKYPYTKAQGRTEIYIPRRTLMTEGEYNFDGEGYFPTIPHESSHASPEVKRNPKFEWWKNEGHDDIWRSKAREFHNKLVQRGYKKRVKDRFKELRKIQRKDDDKYDN